MPGKHHDAPLCRERLFKIVETAYLDPVTVKDPDLAEMRVLEDDAAEIVPHAANDRVDRGLAQLGHRHAKIDPGTLADAEPWADRSRQRAAERRRPVERQQPDQAHASASEPRL